jgi:hypothetical protein
MKTATFRVNEEVVGKSKKLINKTGIIKNIIGEGKKRQYSVLFEDGRTLLVAKRSIRKKTQYNNIPVPANPIQQMNQCQILEEYENENSDESDVDIDEFDNVVEE